MQPDPLQLEVPRAEDYFGVWAIQETWFQTAVARVNRLDLHLHIEEARGQGSGVRGQGPGSRGYAVHDGVAVIELIGPLMKLVSSLEAGTSTVWARRQIRAAAADEAVHTILPLIDSPGGTLKGTADLADEVARAAKAKRVEAYIEDLGASAAYWVASQATRIWANRTAAVGSIGSYAVLYDQSARAAQMGIKVHVLRAGEFKGAGVAGTELTTEQLAEWQRIVNEYNDFFLRGVSAGRRLSLAATRELADGRVHIGQAAVELKLIDGIQSFDAVLGTLTKTRSKPTMSQTQETPQTTELLPAQELKVGTSQPQPATCEELKQCCPGADNDFLIGQLERKATVTEASRAWMEAQNQRIRAATEELEAAKAAAKAPGVDPVSDGPPAKGSAGGGEGTAYETFWAAVAAKERNGMRRDRAVRQVVREDPELHQAMLAEHNEARGRPV